MTDTHTKYIAFGYSIRFVCYRHMTRNLLNYATRNQELALNQVRSMFDGHPAVAAIRCLAS